MPCLTDNYLWPCIWIREILFTSTFLLFIIILYNCIIIFKNYLYTQLLHLYRPSLYLTIITHLISSPSFHRWLPSPLTSYPLSHLLFYLSLVGIPCGLYHCTQTPRRERRESECDNECKVGVDGGQVRHDS